MICVLRTKPQPDRPAEQLHDVMAVWSCVPRSRNARPLLPDTVRSMSSANIHTPALEPQLRCVLEHRIATGTIVLFTGAGFSCDAKAADGQSLPSSQDLRGILWPIAFPGSTEDDESSLADIFECALAQSPKRVCDTLENCLRVDHTSLSDFYSTWFSVPWTRIYTLNIDDLAEAADRRFDLPRRIRTASGSDTVPMIPDELSVVHLNGHIDDPSKATFSAPQYGRRLPGRDPWYPMLAADLVSSTVVFVGTTLDEPPLWQHLELRGSRGASRELRPRSFLVTPHLTTARRQMLKSFNIEHIAMDAKHFANHVLGDLEDATANGLKRISIRQASHRHGLSVPDVSELRHGDADTNLGRYLLGREATFRDVSHGFAIQRSFEDEILGDASMLEPRVTLITGTAATGKSTALRRLALSLDALGKKVGWFDPRAYETNIPTVRRAIRHSGYDYVVIDDVDIFAAQSGPLLQELGQTVDAPRIIAAARSTRAEKFQLQKTLEKIEARFIVAPPLTDDDIDGLIEALSSARLLGKLAGKPRDVQRQVFSGLAGRQLLVAMIEATFGQSFQERIDDECFQLPTEQRLPYAVCALATRYRIGLSVDEILAAVGETTADQLESIDSLKRQHLLVEGTNGHVAVRHRVVAEQVVTWLRKEGQLAQPVEGLLFAMAIKFLRARDTSSKAFRLMIRLMNHRFMIEEIADASAIRSIYELLSSVIADDYHFWLQRGSFELERGDLELAENYLNQARGLAPGDHLVRTAWSYMSLCRATELAQDRDSGWRDRAEEAIAELKEIIELHGTEGPHAFHILGRQGLHYAMRAPLTFDERLRLLDDLRNTVTRGAAIHTDSDELKQLRNDLEGEYLGLATLPKAITEET